MAKKAIQYYEAIGRRKSAVARVRLYSLGKSSSVTVKGATIKKGEMFVNKRQIKADEYFVPLHLTDNDKRFAISIVVKGGGKTGQLEAIIHGLSRAIEKADEAQTKTISKALSKLIKCSYMTDLSVIIPSYNTRDITKRCLDALLRNLKENKLAAEIIVVDNASRDHSQAMLKEYQKGESTDLIRIKTIFNRKNLGYAKANNQGLRIANGKYVLLLNSDALIGDIDFHKLFNYFANHLDVGALTLKVILPDGKLDQAAHRGFPTIWNSFCYFFGLEKIFGKVPGLGQIFGGYHLTHLNLETIHEIDSPCGAFYLLTKSALDKIKGFDDKNFFFYGEDLDLSYRLKEAGYKIIYYPNYSVLHLKRASGLNKGNQEIRKQAKRHFYEAMRIFYQKHYAQKHSWLTNELVYLVIAIKKKIG
jgi:GT2 family glycosyltransferase/ribosomal protein S9